MYMPYDLEAKPWMVSCMAVPWTDDDDDNNNDNDDDDDAIRLPQRHGLTLSDFRPHDAAADLVLLTDRRRGDCEALEADNLWLVDERAKMELELIRWVGGWEMGRHMGMGGHMGMSIQSNDHFDTY
jgi:hypothetical protein